MKMKKELQSILEEITKNKNFNVNQMYEIKEALQCSLSIEQVKLIANEKLNANQMHEIKHALQCGLSIDQVKLWWHQSRVFYKSYRHQQG